MCLRNRRIMRVKIICIILFFLPVICFGESKTVALGHFKNTSSIYLREAPDKPEDASGKIISSYILGQLINCPYIKIVEPTRLLREVILPLSISYEKLLSPETLKVVSKKLNADYVLWGKIEEFSVKRRSNIKIYLWYFWQHRTSSTVKITFHLVNAHTGETELLDTSRLSFSTVNNIFSSHQKNKERHARQILQIYAQNISDKIEEHLKPSPPISPPVVEVLPRVYYSEGITNYQAGNYQQAILSLNTFLSLDAENPLAISAREYLQSSENKLEEIEKNKYLKYRKGRQEKDRGEIDWEKGRISARGEASYLKEIESLSSRYESTKKTALFSSYKNLREIIYSIKIKGSNIGEICEKNPNVQKEVEKIISFSRIIREQLKLDSSYEITVEVSLLDLQKIFPDIYIE